MSSTWNRSFVRSIVRSFGQLKLLLYFLLKVSGTALMERFGTLVSKVDIKLVRKKYLRFLNLSFLDITSKQNLNKFLCPRFKSTRDGNKNWAMWAEYVSKLLLLIAMKQNEVWKSGIIGTEDLLCTPIETLSTPRWQLVHWRKIECHKQVRNANGEKALSSHCLQYLFCSLNESFGI